MMNKRQKKKQLAVIQNKVRKLIKRNHIEVTARHKHPERLSPSDMIEIENTFKAAGVRFLTDKNEH